MHNNIEINLQGHKVIVLFSGGLDSTVALFWVREHGGIPLPLTIHYRGRPAQEKNAVHAIIEYGGFQKPLEVDLPFYTDAGTAARQTGPNSPLRTISPVYLPAKNILFYAIGLYYAELYSAPYLIGGHYKADQHRFPDASPKFFKRFNTLIDDALATLKHVEILTPFLSLTKKDLIILGRTYSIPFHLIWSCYEDSETPCNACEGCLELRRALDQCEHR